MSDTLFHGPLSKCFSRRVLRVASGFELSLEPWCLDDAIVLVERGELEVECPSGACRCFGRGSMIAFARLPIAHLRSVGADPLVLVTVSRTSWAPAMSFCATADRTSTAEYDLGG